VKLILGVNGKRRQVRRCEVCAGGRPGQARKIVGLPVSLTALPESNENGGDFILHPRKGICDVFSKTSDVRVSHYQMQMPSIPFLGRGKYFCHSHYFQEAL